MRALLLAVSLLAPPAWAEQVFRCGNVYQQAPCSGGRAVDVNDARSDEARKAAAAVARANAKLAADLDRERRARDAGIRPAAAVGISARAERAPERKPAVKRNRKAGKETEFQATEPPAAVSPRPSPQRAAPSPSPSG